MTYVKLNNTTLFLDNISFFILENDVITISYRNKIKTIKLTTSISLDEFQTILAKQQLTFIKRVGNYFINMNKLIAFEENLSKEVSKKDNMWVRFTFEIDYVEVEITTTFLNFWKKNNNIN